MNMNKMTTKKASKTQGRNNTNDQDPVKVFCRVRPMDVEQISCIKVIPPNLIVLTTPESAINYKNNGFKEMQYTFNQVFDENIQQKDIFHTIALPLVTNLIQGKNGLLFAYGVTGSGKTYTMTGEPHDGGIMPRCLDVLFNSISKYQAPKYIFKPDKMNGFEIQTEEQAQEDNRRYQVNLINSNRCKTPGKTPRKIARKNSDPEINSRTPDCSVVSDIDEDNAYAVFVNYIETYNNNVYDLLEEIPDEGIRPRTPQNKMIREDGNHNMYVHCVTEVEVKSTQEAFEAFYKGQRRKRMAHTVLNAVSSRSHSVFTIRLVQAPLDSQGEGVHQSSNSITISQLSLVDLAGSERTNRTKNHGQRLREAGNINNSLMTLRSCLEMLRENQINGTNKIVPYRDARITHLFKNYFDGEGQVSMIVCINPKNGDFDETLQVMKFAETAREVQVARPTQIKTDSEFIPGRRKANQLIKQVLQKYQENGQSLEEDDRMTNLEAIYNLGEPFPLLEITEPTQEKPLKDLMIFLENRISKRNSIIKDFENKQNSFRNDLIEMEKNDILNKQQIINLRSSMESERQKYSGLDGKIQGLETLTSTLQRKNNEYEDTIQFLKEELGDKDMRLRQECIEKDRVKQKYSSKIVTEQEKMNREMNYKLKSQRLELETQMRDKESKLRKVKKILDDVSGSSNSANSKEGTKSIYSRPLTLSATMIANYDNKENPRTPRHPRKELTTSDSVVKQMVAKLGQPTSIPTPNPRHRRSRSANDGVWLEHRAAAPAPLNTLMQPSMQKRVSVDKLTNVKDVVNNKTSKYCLVTQETDSAGELETVVYKADVVPTYGGGAQVIFNDVETLKQSSPTGSPTRKRTASSDVLPSDVQEICSVAIEGHAIQNSKRPRQ